MYLLGFDAGTSAIKACLLDAHSGRTLASATSPATEMPIAAPQPGWAEQHPDLWYENLLAATQLLRKKTNADLRDVAAIGIAYQMHGLVLIDQQHNPLRPAILWCDNRAVPTGKRIENDLGRDNCLQHLLNLPGNFTFSRLLWVKQNEPELYRKTWKVLLPGDYLALRLTGKPATTASGLSEWIAWDFTANNPAAFLFDHYDIDPQLLPDVVPTFAPQGHLTHDAAQALGLKPSIPVAYRAGDQPNNALALNVFEPGEIAATAGTSAVVYGVSDSPACDPKNRLNTFLHLNHAPQKPRLGLLLCVNGAGCLNAWLKHNIMPPDNDYPHMNELAAAIPPGADGLIVLPYGNSAERTLENKNPGAAFLNLHFNTHTRAHLLRAAQEGVVFALHYGIRIMHQLGLPPKTVRAADANMFQSPIFAAAFAATTKATVELYDTDGAQGAARGAGIGAGIYAARHDAFTSLTPTRTFHPDETLLQPYQDAYRRWESALQKHLNATTAH